jgi:hypothetical protein
VASEWRTRQRNGALLHAPAVRTRAQENLSARMSSLNIRTSKSQPNRQSKACNMDTKTTNLQNHKCECHSPKEEVNIYCIHLTR